MIAFEEEKTLVCQANKRIKVVSQKAVVVVKKVGKCLGETVDGLAESLLPKYFKYRRNLKEYNKRQENKTDAQGVFARDNSICYPNACFLYAVSTSRRPVNPLLG